MSANGFFLFIRLPGRRAPLSRVRFCVHRTARAVLLWQQCRAARAILRRGHARQAELYCCLPGAHSRPLVIFRFANRICTAFPRPSVYSENENQTQISRLFRYSFLTCGKPRECLLPSARSSTSARSSGAFSPSRHSTRTGASRPLISCSRTAALRIAARRGWRRSRAAQVRPLAPYPYAFNLNTANSPPEEEFSTFQN
jgi:hypothetical protein